MGGLDRERNSESKRWKFNTFYLLIGLLILGGINTLVTYVNETNLRLDPLITGKISSDFETADRIEAIPGTLKEFNVLLITLDTTRADYLGCYGHRGIKTPVIDRLANEGVIFENAITPSPSTLPAHASILTGLDPYHHGVRANGVFRLDERFVSLAEILQKIGYHTGAVISAFVLDSRFGLDQGFDEYYDNLTADMEDPPPYSERIAEKTNLAVKSWLDKNGNSRFFLWVHYFDPHAPYVPPQGFNTQYADHPYDGEIAYVDAQIGILLEELDKRKLHDNTLIVLAADHGEGLGEHGERTHSLFIYDTTIQVPLIFAAPSGLPKKTVISRQTGLIDIMPTILELLGEPLPENLDGESLCRTPKHMLRPMVIETLETITIKQGIPLVGLRREDYKYIVGPRPEVYDLRTDPHELVNLYSQKPELVKSLHDEFTAIIEGEPNSMVLDILPNHEINEELRKHLEGLGYIRGE